MNPYSFEVEKLNQNAQSRLHVLQRLAQCRRHDQRYISFLHHAQQLIHYFLYLLAFQGSLLTFYYLFGEGQLTAHPTHKELLRAQSLSEKLNVSVVPPLLIKCLLLYEEIGTQDQRLEGTPSGNLFPLGWDLRLAHLFC